MPIPFDPHTDPDFIQGLFANPDDEALLAEIALATGQAQNYGVNMSAGGDNTVINQVTGVSVFSRFKVDPGDIE